MAAIRVRAFREGFYKSRRFRPGDEFEVPADTLQSSWFDPVDPKAKLRQRPEPTPKQREEAEKAARGKRKAAERARILAESKVVPGEKKPVALSELHPELTAREKQIVEAGASPAPDVPAAEGDKPLA